MGHQVFSEELVASVVKELQIADLAHATIGEVLLVASRLEQQSGIPFIRMDQGSPGLPANRVGIEAEKAALDRGVGAQYPATDGIPELKREASRFVKAFVDIDISPRACIPTTGSVAASFGAFVITTQRVGKRHGPVYRSGISHPEIPVAHHRGEVGTVRHLPLSGRGVEGEVGELSETRRHRGYRLLQSEQSGVDLSGGQRTGDYR